MSSEAVVILSVVALAVVLLLVAGIMLQLGRKKPRTPPDHRPASVSPDFRAQGALAISLVISLLLGVLVFFLVK